MKAGFRSTTGYSGFVDAVISVFIAAAAGARIPPVLAAAAAADLVARSWMGGDLCVWHTGMGSFLLTGSGSGGPSLVWASSFMIVTGLNQLF